MTTKDRMEIEQAAPPPPPPKVQEDSDVKQDGQKDDVVGLSVGINASNAVMAENVSQLSFGSSHHRIMKPIREDEHYDDDTDLGLDLSHSGRGISVAFDIPLTETTSDDSAGTSCSPTRHYRKMKERRRRAVEYHKIRESHSFGSFASTVSHLRHFGHHWGEESIRSKKRRRLNVVLGSFLALTTGMLIIVMSRFLYVQLVEPSKKQKALQKAIRAHDIAAALRAQQCQGVTWQTACDRLLQAGGVAGARRRRLWREEGDGEDVSDEEYDETNVEEENDALPLEEQFLASDDPTVTYDSNCLRAYRLQMYGNITFPYYSSQLLYAGGNHTMALFIQHGALRDAPDYFCSFKELMLRQHYRPFSEILIIAPDFTYEHDPLVYPNDAFWNSTKPWGDWRVGAESDPKCCGDTGKTVSSFEVLDHMLAMLTSKKLYPHMHKVSFVGHSAGGQMVQRYAVMSVLASLYGIGTDINVEFIVANPSSYTYLDDRRYKYNCGFCECNSRDCKCNKTCTEPPYTTLAVPKLWHNSSDWPCYRWNYDRWPYGIGSFSNEIGQSIPYALRSGFLGVDRALRIYRELHVVYMVGQNDTCNDMLPTCDASCSKRDDHLPGEWPCFRNEMDTRCPAMLQGPNRRTRAWQYLRYLRELYGEPIHALIEVPGVGHNASAMFGSFEGMRELFGSTNIHRN